MIALKIKQNTVMVMSIARLSMTVKALRLFMGLLSLLTDRITGYAPTLQSRVEAT